MYFPLSVSEDFGDEFLLQWCELANILRERFQSSQNINRNWIIAKRNICLEKAARFKSTFTTGLLLVIFYEHLGGDCWARSSAIFPFIYFQSNIITKSQNMQYPKAQLITKRQKTPKVTTFYLPFTSSKIFKLYKTSLVVFFFKLLLRILLLFHSKSHFGTIAHKIPYKI